MSDSSLLPKFVLFKVGPELGSCLFRGLFYDLDTVIRNIPNDGNSFRVVRLDYSSGFSVHRFDGKVFID